MSAGQLTFNDVMKMFRDELLDLNEILNYIKLAPDDSAATTSVVSASWETLTCAQIPHKPQGLMAASAPLPIAIQLEGEVSFCPLKSQIRPCQMLREVKSLFKNRGTDFFTLRRFSEAASGSSILSCSHVPLLLIVCHTARQSRPGCF